ncbi:hypothetical protein [Achromobacter xylosoxidans]|uniref:hypothetical protein n=1 Tax=Alcaligenes xylosoxydans xylosoxydans TaxID=85698 RepID=UPI002A74D73D|nr:hypothetical protein [Achromobacter xylosoxidans]WPQ32777.1 hypothetical protein SLH34_19285 [Achromobacter xylosoxidans]
MVSSPNKAQVWRPLGQVLDGPSGLSWAVSHASYPTARVLTDDVVRVYFSCRDADNKSHLASVDLGLRDDHIKRVSEPQGPLLSPGPRGAFDADGVTTSCVIEADGRLLAYYLGWTIGRSAPFTNFIGLATAPTGATKDVFTRHGAAPIVGRSEINPYTLGYPWVSADAGDWRMWFGSHTFWGPQGLEMEHIVREARSHDGLAWTPLPGVTVDLARAADPAEFAVSRPVVLALKQRKLMWYARRNPGYQLGFALSDDDGQSWQRHDARVSFESSAASWESEERTYPCVFRCGANYYMLYNGNGYGRTGFGIARLLNPDSLLA